MKQQVGQASELLGSKRTEIVNQTIVRILPVGFEESQAAGHGCSQQNLRLSGDGSGLGVQAGVRDTDVSLLPSRSPSHRHWQTRFLRVPVRPINEGFEAFLRLCQAYHESEQSHLGGANRPAFGQSQLIAGPALKPPVASLCRILLDDNPCLGRWFLRVRPASDLVYRHDFRRSCKCRYCGDISGTKTAGPETQHLQRTVMVFVVSAHRSDLAHSFEAWGRGLRLDARTLSAMSCSGSN